jgi:DNA topoisomerase-1
MQLAQRLYEGVDIGGETVGLITYMRTDGVQMAAEAIAGARAVIAEDFGKAYVPEAPRLYKTKAKNAQEAHEAIRPTDLARKPEDVARYVDKDQLRLYELIWKAPSPPRWKVPNSNAPPQTSARRAATASTILSAPLDRW